MTGSYVISTQVLKDKGQTLTKRVMLQFSLNYFKIYAFRGFYSLSWLQMATATTGMLKQNN